ncbi:MAG TPA: hypothetical protein VF134_03720 [Candidatus Dormibacteraeota bacterium]
MHKSLLRPGDAVVVGSMAVPAVVVSPDVRFMLTRGPRHPVVGVAVRLAGGAWEPAFFLPEDVRVREELEAPAALAS